MKTFTETERREIEQRIQAACAGKKFEGCRPEFFIPAAGRNVAIVRHAVRIRDCVECSVIIGGLFRLGGHTLN